MSIRDFSEQEAVNAGLPLEAYGGAVLTQPIRAIHCNVANTYKCTTATGTRVILAMSAGQLYPYRIVGVSASNGAAISSTNNLVIPIL